MTKTPGIVFLTLLLLTPCARPQSSTGSVSGTVQDSSGARVAEAEVTLSSPDTKIVLKTRTNESGLYFFPSVVAGAYELGAAAPGMERFDGKLTVQTAQNAVVDPVLKPGSINAHVEVVDVTPLVTTDNATVASGMEHARIEQLPINGRVLNTLVATLPGLEGFRAYGAPSNAMEVVLDGAVVTDRRYNMSLFSQNTGIGAIEEFRVESDAISAKYTRPTNLIAATKSGTNAIHGTAYEVNRNNGVGLARSRTDFYTKAPQLNKNEFGVNAGGPVFIPKVYDGRNKTFWFVNWEAERLAQFTTSMYNVPTEAMRNGDFSGLVDTQGRLYTIYDPLTTGPGPDYVRTPFPGNQIPLNRESPVSKYLFSIIPKPSNNLNPLNDFNLYVPTGRYERFSSTGGRLDQRIGQNDLIYVRYTNIQAPNSQITALPATNKVAGYKNVIDSDRNGSVNWTHIVSPLMSNELLAAVRYRIGGGYTGLNPSVDTNWFDQLNIPNPFGVQDWPQFSNIGLGSSNQGLTSAGKDRANETFWVLDDNVTRVQGKHQFQFGGHLRYNLSNIHPNDQGATSYQFNTLATSLYSPTASTPTSPAATPFTGSNLANFFLGVTNYQFTLQRAWNYLREGEGALYFQDNWNLTPRLKVNLGLRWEAWIAPRDKNNALVGFDPANHAIVLGTDLNTLYATGDTLPSVVAAYQALGLKFESYRDAGLPRNLLQNQNANFGPRASFAYRALDGKGSFVVRGGYSMSYFTVSQSTALTNYNSITPLNGTFSYNPYTDSTQSPNGQGNYGLIGMPQYQLGVNDKNVVDLTKPRSITRGTATVNFFDPNLPTSRVHTWNLTIEKEVAANTVARVRYVGNHSSDLLQTWNLNNAPADYIYYSTTKQPKPTGEYSNVALRPYDQTVLGTVNETRATGFANVQNFAAEVEHRFGKGYAYNLSYVLSNAFAINGSVPAITQFLPGAVPTDPDAMNRFLNYQRDTGVPKHELKWNWLVDVPVGRGKPLLRGSSRWLDEIVGGWQIAGIGSLHSTFFQLPSGNWNFTGAPLEFYGYQYPIQNCTSGSCQRGYLWYNGYIPANQINSHDAKGNPNGYEGVPANYKPYVTPLIPYGSTTLPANAPSNVNIASYYDTNNVWIPLNNGTTQITGYNNNLNPYRNQYATGVRQWNLDASIFKNFPIHERALLRFTADFFNVFNHPGNPNSIGGDGFLNTRSSGNAPRTLQLGLRLNW